MEVTHVLKGISGRATLASVTELERTLAQKDDQEADAEANKDWGVSVAKEAAIPPNVKSSMMEAVLSVDEVQSLATEQGDEGFFSNVFTNRMCSTDGSRQHRASWIRRSISGTLMDVAILCLLSC
jgi:hypothetical protein